MKKTMNIIKNILVWMVVAIAIGMMIFTIFSVTTFDHTERSLFGYKFFIVSSDSMSATDFDAGDVIYVEEVDPATLQVGDIITYTSQNTSNFGETVTHKIRTLTMDANGEPGFITYGTTTDTDDETVVTYPYVIGKYVGSLPKVGYFFSFLKTIPGYIVCILIPFLLLIGYYGINSVRLFRRYKAEQMDDLKAERKQLEEERRQSAEMMKELQQLREQVARNNEPPRINVAEELDADIKEKTDKE